MKKQVLTNEQMGNFFLQFSYLIHAGFGNVDSLVMLAEREDDPSNKKLLSDMAEKAENGERFSDVLKESGVFSEYACGLVYVGENTGRMEEATTALAEYFEGRVALDKRLRSALLYPVILLQIMLVVIVVLLVYVLPIFNDVYAQLGSGLGGLAGGLLSLGAFLSKIMPFLCVVLGLITVFLVIFASSQGFRNGIINKLRRNRGDKGIFRLFNMSRFAKGLSMGISSGLLVDEAVEYSVQLVEDAPDYLARCKECTERYRKGETMVSSLESAGLLPKLECRILETGLKGGAGDAAMAEVAKRLSEEANGELDDKISRVEPALVIIASVLVGIILLSVMLPLMQIMTTIG